ncbi:MAG: hypothetical protein R3C56_14660 [Pirellulaceae bacterium]
MSQYGSGLLLLRWCVCRWASSYRIGTVALTTCAPGLHGIGEQGAEIDAGRRGDRCLPQCHWVTKRISTTVD